MPDTLAALIAKLGDCPVAYAYAQMRSAYTGPICMSEARSWQRQADAALLELANLVMHWIDECYHTDELKNSALERADEAEAEVERLRQFNESCIAINEAKTREVERLRCRRCDGCKWWEPHPYDEDGICRSTITYTPDYDDEPRTVEYIALYASNNEYDFGPPADFACNRWAAREEAGDEC